jgi:hypothetical protein
VEQLGRVIHVQIYNPLRALFRQKAHNLSFAIRRPVSLPSLTLRRISLSLDDNKNEGFGGAGFHGAPVVHIANFCFSNWRLSAGG